MAPGTRRAANRGGYAEHDDFEGLPVRQWRQEWATIAPPEKQEQHDRNDIWAHELIHGMPKDSNLLPAHTQELLRAARSGRLYNIPAPAEDEEVDSETVLPDKADKKNENDNTDKKFTVKIWKQIPRNVEATTTSYLAPRRKGTISIASKTVPSQSGGPTVTRATIKRLDAAGNPYTEEVTLEGQQVDGEIISTRLETAAVVNNNIAPIANANVRKRAPPPKRKKGGPGRGKKKVKLAVSGSGQALGAAPVDGAAPIPGSQNGEKRDGEANQDSEMADGDDQDNNDDDDDESGDSSEDDEKTDGQEPGNGHQRETTEPTESHDKEMTDAPTVDASVLDNADIEMKDGEATPEKPIPPNPLTLAPPAASLASGSPKVEGSPLKNVLISSPTKDEAPLLAQPPLDTMPAIPKAPVEESVLAEPPSTIVGDEPDKAVDRDVPPPLEESVSTDEALLPPPPEQVGNIASPKQSPKASPKPEMSQDQAAGEGEDIKDETKNDDAHVPQKPIMPHLAESNMTEDTIKPDDSASAGRPATASGPSSEVAGPTVDPAAESAANSRAQSTEAVADAPPPVVDVEPSAEDIKAEPSNAEAITGQAKEEFEEQPEAEPVMTEEVEAAAPDADAPPTQGDEPDLLDGLMGELDRDDPIDSTQPQPDAVTEAQGTMPEHLEDLDPKPEFES